MPDINIENYLYPPIIPQSFVPAMIYTESEHRVYFALSDFNTIDQLKKNYGSTQPGYAQVTIRYQKTNKSAWDPAKMPSDIKICNVYTDETRTGKDKYYIRFYNSELKNGAMQLNEYYKVQIRLTSANCESNIPNESSIGIDNWLAQNLEYFSEWSTVALVYGISTPTLTSNLTQNGTTQCSSLDLKLSGRIKFSERKDKETLKKYRITLLSGTTVLEDSGDIVLSEYQNKNEIKYLFTYNFAVGNYIVKVDIVTQNLYEKTFSYNIRMSSTSANLNVELGLVPQPSDGRIRLNVYGTNSVLASGRNFTIRRLKYGQNYWEQVDTVVLPSAGTSFTWYDYTAQPGVLYRYEVIRLYSDPLEIKRTAKYYMIYTDDIFLSGENKQLKIKFNPQVSNFAIRTSDNVIETIGSQYPFIRRGGNTYYKTFSLSGTISFLGDDNQIFKAFDFTWKDEHQKVYNRYGININSYTDFIREREFRDQVIKFLYSDTVKLYRSLTEGNILVKLLNVSLTPNTSLGRMIYDFSCELQEIDECSYENYVKYNVLVKNIYVNLPHTKRTQSNQGVDQGINGYPANVASSDIIPEEIDFLNNKVNKITYYDSHKKQGE